MDKKEAEEYLKKLEEFEKTINSEDDEENFDLNFIEEINTLLSKLEGEINIKIFFILRIYCLFKIL